MAQPKMSVSSCGHGRKLLTLYERVHFYANTYIFLYLEANVEETISHLSRVSKKLYFVPSIICVTCCFYI